MILDLIGFHIHSIPDANKKVTHFKPHSSEDVALMFVEFLLNYVMFHAADLSYTQAHQSKLMH